MQSLLTEDGLRLHLRHWPAPVPARGTVQIVHGLGEHIGRYEHVAAALNAAGWDVIGHDQRGHGRSEGARGTIPHPDALLADLARVMDEWRRRPGQMDVMGHAGRRRAHLLLGHSMGGLVAARFVAEGLAATPAGWQRGVDGLVLSSPALEIPLAGAQKLLLALLAPLAPRVRLANGLDPAWVSRDPAVVAAYRADPLVHDRVTPGLVRFMVDGGVFARAQAGAWRVPTLLMWAGADRCVVPAGSAAFAAAAPPAVLGAREWPGLFHEIFNEPEQAQVLAELTRWLERF
jgi:alpha-beta hydrolase superfamily lysophospholipase